MKILVTGVKGQLGYDVVRLAKLANIEAVGVDIEEMDITDKGAVERVISDDYDVVVHCAAYTAVDLAESNIELCRKINWLGTKNIMEVCRERNIKMMYFSTDYVFDGEGSKPWIEDDEKAPLNVYGQSKYEGELEVMKLDMYYILRISWVFGINGKNFIKTMLSLAKTRDELNVVDDQIGSPTYTYDLAALVIKMIQSDKYGIYHVSNEGYCSWYEFACEIMKQAGIEIKINPVTSEAFKSVAKRPHNSKMSKEKLQKAGFERLPSWQNALKRYLKELDGKKVA